MGNAITKATGMQVRVVPSGSNKSFLLPMLRGETTLTGLAYMGLYSSIYGTWDWWEEGPQPFSIVWLGEPGNSGVVTRADSGIFSIKDLKGKRFSDARRLNPSDQDSIDAFLAFGGLSMADVIPVDVPNYTEGIRYVIEGKMDAAQGAQTGAISYELLASVHGGRFPEFPP